jgi:inhibitor of KinA sporulation pathway (predicted exonuclease)
MPYLGNREVNYLVFLDLEGTLEITEMSSVITDCNYNIVDSIQIFCQNKFVDDDTFTNYVCRKYGRFGMSEKFMESCVPFETALAQYHQWLVKNAQYPEKCLFLTCGHWDLSKQVPLQCQRYGIAVPAYLKTYVNIKEIFQLLFRIESKGMKFMLDHLKIPLEGYHHCALDDCMNLVTVTAALNNIICTNNLDFNQYFIIRSARN